jgi:hypothetical protein
LHCARGVGFWADIMARHSSRFALAGLLSLISGVGVAQLHSRLRVEKDADSANLPVPHAAATVPHRLPTPDLSSAILAQQAEAYSAKRPKTVLELQPHRVTTSMAIGDRGKAVLVNLNPAVNEWYLLLLRWSDGRQGAYHLANGDPESCDLTLDPDHSSGLTLVDSLGERECPLWSDDAALSLDAAAASRDPQVPLCAAEVTLRLPTAGRRTTLEWTTDFLRDNVWGGERITVLVRAAFFQDAYLDTSETILPEEPSTVELASDDGPSPARLDAAFRDSLLVPGELGLALANSSNGLVPAGRWIPLLNHPDVYTSVVRPDLLDAEILKSHRPPVSRLDAVESSALAYLIAFDLDAFELGFALGTEHPRVGWSPRALDAVRDASLPGPDGIDDISPLVATGMVPRAEAYRTTATFTGGFKREHGAFRASDLAYRNSGTHYGFIESGVVLSKLQPGLATLFVLDDGLVDMRTWSAEDDALLPRIRSARQNGLPVIERDPGGGPSVPGRQVSQWVPGNWSGSQDKSFRTVRAGACLQQKQDRHFLIYAYFSSATPSAMARVFQAYDCEYAMMLDINALEHTYFAIYHRESERLVVEHLVRGMEVLDKKAGDAVVPRFLGFADNRDFFYVKRRGD